MIKNISAIAAGVVVLAGSTLTPALAGDFQWQDNYVNVRNLWDDKQPGIKGNIQEHVLNFTHADGWEYGQNLVSIELEQFTGGDPANSAFRAQGGTGSAEFYGVFRTVLSGNKISGTKDFAWGPFRDVGLEIGFDYDTQSDQFASTKKLAVFGPQFQIDIPKGFWNVSLVLSHEWNTDGDLPNGNATNYDATGELETAWAVPFSLGPLPLDFTGYTNIILPKGKGATGDFQHRTEILAHPKLLTDIGALTGIAAPGKFEGGVGFEYWQNKFGATESGLGYPFDYGTHQYAVFIELGYHLD